jgi:uncharacterized membrane protein
MRFAIAYAAAAVIFLAADAVWLGWIARSFYRDHLGALLLERPSMPVAGLFYAMYIGGIVLFAITPGLRDQSWLAALGFGVTFGLVAYGTYDLTNLATLRGWPMAVSLVDLVWGAFVTGLAATAGYAITRWFD